MIVVVGSANIDLVAQVHHLPAPGETVFGSNFQRTPGGKGANQAVAAARGGAEVLWVGRVGEDAHGDQLLQSMQQAGVNVEAALRDVAPTGTALITVEQSGENTIVVVSGANSRVSVEDVQIVTPLIARADWLLLQMELPPETVLSAAQAARRQGTQVMFNAAPAVNVPAELYPLCDVIVVNEEEVSALTGLGSPFDPASAARMLISAGAGMVVVTLGAQGSVIVTNGGEINVPAFPARAVDTTAAGDTFVGNLAAALDRGDSLEDAARFASAAAALSTESPGAQAAMPDRAATLRRLETA